MLPLELNADFRNSMSQATRYLLVNSRNYLEMTLVDALELDAAFRNSIELSYSLIQD